MAQTAQHKANIQIVFIGDSITDYWSTTVKDTWHKFYAPRGAYNYGIAADMTQNLIWRMEHNELDGVNAKVVVLMIGNFLNLINPLLVLKQILKNMSLVLALRSLRLRLNSYSKKKINKDLIRLLNYNLEEL